MKRKIGIILAFALAFSMIGCMKEKTPVDKDPETEQTEDIKENDKEETPKEEEDEGPTEVIIYTGDDNAENIISHEEEVVEVTPQKLMDLLLENEVFAEPVKVNSFEKGEDNILKLDLDESFQTQLQSMGTSGEAMMMGGVVNTMLSAYEADGIIITINGNTLESGHAIYDGVLDFYGK